MRIEINRSNSEILSIHHTPVILWLYILGNRILAIFKKVIAGKKQIKSIIIGGWRKQIVLRQQLAITHPLMYLINADFYNANDCGCHIICISAIIGGMMYLASKYETMLGMRTQKC